MIIINERLRNAILIALADKETMSILDCAMIKSKSMTEIVRETKIPQTSTFRKIKWLLDEGLLMVDSIVITREGKKSSLFKSVLRSIDVRYDFGNLVEVDVIHNIDPTEKNAVKLFSLNSS